MIGYETRLSGSAGRVVALFASQPEDPDMPQFLFVYHGGKMPETPEAAARAVSAWETWMKDMGPALVQPGNPVGLSRTVSADGIADNGGANPVSGFSVVEATDIDSATEMARGCPMVADGEGSVEIAQIHEM